MTKSYVGEKTLLLGLTNRYDRNWLNEHGEVIRMLVCSAKRVPLHPHIRFSPGTRSRSGPCLQTTCAPGHHCVFPQNGKRTLSLPKYEVRAKVSHDEIYIVML